MVINHTCIVASSGQLTKTQNTRTISVSWPWWFLPWVRPRWVWAGMPGSGRAFLPGRSVHVFPEDARSRVTCSGRPAGERRSRTTVAPAVGQGWCGSASEHFLPLEQAGPGRIGAVVDATCQPPRARAGVSGAIQSTSFIRSHRSDASGPGPVARLARSAVIVHPGQRGLDQFLRLWSRASSLRSRC